MRPAKALVSLRICAGWSEPLLVVHTTLLEISCHGSIMTSRMRILSEFIFIQHMLLNAITRFLAHLSRRLMGELILYQSLRRPSVRHPSVVCPSVCQHFQTSPLKQMGQFNSNFIWRLLRTREQKFVQMVLVT